MRSVWIKTWSASRKGVTASLSSASRPGSRWLLSLWCWQWPLEAGWPGWRTRRPLSVSLASSEPGPGWETSWAPGLRAPLCCPLRRALFLRSLHPRYKATLAPGPLPPPPGCPGQWGVLPRLFTFKSPIQRFAFKCFFPETIASCLTPEAATRNRFSCSFKKSKGTFCSNNTD